MQRVRDRDFGENIYEIKEKQAVEGEGECGREKFGEVETQTDDTLCVTSQRTVTTSKKLPTTYSTPS